MGASDKSKDLVANMVATDFANDELTSNRSHKVSIDSLIQDTQEFNGIQPYLKPPQSYLRGWIKAMYQMVLIPT